MKHEVIYEYRGRVEDRAAFHVTVRLLRGGEDLGLFRTTVSGPQVSRRDRSVTDRQFWRLVAEQLAVELRRGLGEKAVRTDYSDIVDEVPINVVEVFAAAERRDRVVPDLTDEAIVATFDAD